jgi:hypothetical protein
MGWGDSGLRTNGDVECDVLALYTALHGLFLLAHAGEVDSDGDLICDEDERDGDTDGDGLPDVFDPDDDGDGVPTAEEDADGDGDPRDDDLDGYGEPDYLDPETPRDIDRDGHVSEQYGGDDCDDARFGINPNVDHDPLYDGEDWDCDDPDGTLDFDGDRDGFLSAVELDGGDDCDDYDPEVNPLAEEDPGPVDRDCDGWTDPAGALVARGGCDCEHAGASGWLGLVLSLGLRRRRP